MSAANGKALGYAIQSGWIAHSLAEHGIDDAGVMAHDPGNPWYLYVRSQGVLSTHPAPSFEQPVADLATEADEILQRLARNLRRYLQRTPTSYRHHAL